ncbi:MAG: Unknown protein [uncultured Sulfurovum sp.]|uniref:Uncharacterized protein n=1 Tax=uncultured Sulfurovum sp. TaxID=269237 RepID=A0A6S6SL32_9BACT|nr:MAG: Unknown protein [uncultured Sulfurovum sp.]
MLKDTTKIDTKYDDSFINELKLPWLPWVGINFHISNPKVIILGESTYNWNPDDKKIMNRINNNNHLRVLHQNHAINPKSKSRYVRNIERAIFNIKTPLYENKLNLWNSVIYHNLVLRYMPTIKSRPTYKDYIIGWKKYLHLINLLTVDECLVYGLESKKYNALIAVLKENNIEFQYKKLLTKVGRSYPRIIEFRINNLKHKVLFIRHPSSHFSWEKWGEIINENLSLQNFLN